MIINEFVQHNSSRMQLLNNLSEGWNMYRVAIVPPLVQSRELPRHFFAEMNDAEALSACIYYKFGLYSLMQKAV